MINTIDITVGGNGPDIELGPYLADDTDVVIGMERERDRFEWVVEDVSFTISNIGGTAGALMEQLRKASKWTVSVKVDGVRRFWGYLDPKSALYRYGTGWITFTAFSMTKALMERAAVTMTRHNIWPLGGSQGNTLLELFNYELGIVQREQFKDIFAGFDLGAFASRPINFPASTSSDPLEGRFKNLSKDTTWAMFFREAAKYYNAEFFVDPVTGKLTMRPRNVPLTTSPTVIDDLIRDDSGIDLKYVEEGALDWVQTFMKVSIGAPEYRWEITRNAEANVTALPGTYYVVYYVNGTPTYRSEKFVLTPDAIPQITKTDVNEKVKRLIYIHPKVGPAGVTERRVFKDTDAWTGEGFRECTRPMANLDTEEQVDYLVLAQLVTQADVMPEMDYNSSTVWCRYNEATGVWDPPVYEGGATPQGTILDIRPRLEFSSSSDANVTLEYTPKDTWTLFGREMNYEFFRDNYRELFVTKKSLTFRTKGVALQLGDLLTFSGSNSLSMYGPLIAKRARVNITQEYTDITAFQWMG